MARQIQFRRGTADEHKNFTGAEGEITVDTTNRTIRVHDGVTAGGTMLARADALNGADYVVAWQTPTAENNYTWYRKYKSGWVEQGGVQNPVNSSGLVIKLAVLMSNSNYTCYISPAGNDNDTDGWATLQAVLCGASSSGYIYGKSTTSIRLSCVPTVGINWLVTGIAA